MGRVAGKMAFITGGGSGLGRASALMLAREGAKVAIGDLDAKAAEDVAGEIKKAGGDGFAYQMDVASEKDWQKVLPQAAKAMGGLNILFNNAGIGGGGTVEETDFAVWKHVMAVDADSVFLGCKYALPLMRPHAPGSIINTSSIAGLIAGHNLASYNAAKAAVWLLTKSVALHCAKQKYNIRCNSIHPTFINTPILNRFKQTFGEEEALAKLGRQIPLGTVGEPDDVAYAVLFLASDESKFITGTELKLDGGISAM